LLVEVEGLLSHAQFADEIGLVHLLLLLALLVALDSFFVPFVVQSCVVGVHHCLLLLLALQTLFFAPSRRSLLAFFGLFLVFAEPLALFRNFLRLAILLPPADLWHFADFLATAEDVLEFFAPGLQFVGTLETEKFFAEVARIIRV